MRVNNSEKTFDKNWSRAIRECGGFTMVPNLLLDEVFGLGLNTSQLVVLIVLIRHRWTRDGEIFPSYETIARQSGQSARNVKRCVEYLSGESLIHVIGSNGISNRYDLEPLVAFLDTTTRSEAKDGQFGVSSHRQIVIGTSDKMSYYKDPFQDNDKDTLPDPSESRVNRAPP